MVIFLLFTYTEMFTLVGFFDERMQLVKDATLKDVWYIILKVFHSSTRFLYIGQKNMHPKKKLRHCEVFKAKKGEFGWISTGLIFWYVIAQSFLGSMVYLTRKVPTGTSRQKRVWTRPTASTPAQNKAIRKISIFKFSQNESYYIPFDAESWDESNGV